MEDIDARTSPECLPIVQNINIKSENMTENSTDNSPEISLNNSTDNSPSNSPENTPENTPKNSPENSPNKTLDSFKISQNNGSNSSNNSTAAFHSTPEKDSKRRKSSFEGDEHAASSKILKFNSYNYNSLPQKITPNFLQSSTHNLNKTLNKTLNNPINTTLNKPQNIPQNTPQNTPQSTPQNTTPPERPPTAFIDISTDTNFQELIGFMHTKYQEQIVSTIQGSSKFSDIIQHWQTAYTSFLTKQHDLTRENLKLEKENADLKMSMQRLVEVQDLLMQKQQFDDQITVSSK